MPVIQLESEPSRYLMNRDSNLACLMRAIGDYEYSVNDEYFANLCHSIVEQMLSMKVGNTLFGRLEDKCGGRVTIETVRRLDIDEIRSIGVSRRKAESIMSLSHGTTESKLRRLNELDDNQIIAYLTSFNGVGLWTAKMFLIFSLDRKDVLPYEDAAFLAVYKWLYNARKIDQKAVCNKCKRWKPYSSIAARYFYRALNTGLIESTTKSELINAYSV